MKKFVGIITAVVMAFTVFVIPFTGEAAYAGEGDDLTVAFTGTDSVEYTGEALTPEFDVTCDGATLTADDFDASWENNTLPGTAKVTVAGKGTYAGKNGSAEFEIAPAKIDVTATRGAQVKDVKEWNVSATATSAIEGLTYSYRWENGADTAKAIVKGCNVECTVTVEGRDAADNVVAKGTDSIKTPNFYLKDDYTNKRTLYLDDSGRDYGSNAVMWARVQNQASGTKYLIAIDRNTCDFVVYTGKKGNWKVYKHWACCVGQSAHKTPAGTHKVFARKSCFHGWNEKSHKTKYTCFYATRFYKSVYVHSQIHRYMNKSRIKDARIGVKCSHGCVRLKIANAKWVYQNCKNGTKVIVSDFTN